MGGYLYEWASLILRFSHIIFAIGWIGSSLYFMWLDASLERPEKNADPNLEGFLWMVHSGGFYAVERRRLAPGEVPPRLHWFKWEALFTLLTGLSLLALIYYGRAEIFLLGPGAGITSVATAIATSISIVVGSWLAYDWLWSRSWAERAVRFTTLLSLVGLVLLCLALNALYSGRGAYIHLGAILGTLMVLNVWLRILPAQQKMIDATASGHPMDVRHSHRAKRRSVHNTYLTLPVLFTMISQHYPMTFGHSQRGLLLCTFVAAGVAIRYAMVQGTYRRPLLAAIGGAVVLVLVPMGMTLPQVSSDAASQPVDFATIKPLVARHCLSCHSKKPFDPNWPSQDPPAGLALDNDATVLMRAEDIKEQVVARRLMPFGNRTNMTDAERDLVRRWVEGLVQKP